MGLWSWLTGRSDTKTAQIAKPAVWLQAQAAENKYELPGVEDYSAQVDLYTKLTWVQIAVSAVSKVAAGIPLQIMQLVGEDAEAVFNHPFELLLKRPNPLQSRFELLQGTLNYLALTGNAYWWLNRRGENATVDEVWLLPGNRINPVPDENLYLRGYIYSSGGVEIPLELWEVAHFRQFNPSNPFVGLSPLEALAATASADLSMVKYNASYFDKGNAKMPGALAFADPIEDSDWNQLKTDIEREYGGTKRKLMMLRNVGTGGVSWIPMALTQQDMQFLEGRRANKEEIFALFAPGLASVLDVNATEANATTGKSTFLELAVWPLLQLLQEKVTNDILPAYGEGVMAQFEDLRTTDQEMELSQISTFAQFHTIDEVRAKWYKGKPLGDDRGELLAAEVGKGFTRTDTEEPPSMVPAVPGAPAVDLGGEDSQDVPESEDIPEGDSQAGMEVDDENRADEARKFRRWRRNRPNKPITAFKRQYLTLQDLVDEAIRMEDGAAGDATFQRQAFFPTYP
jgi:HK97 family phage portal protein